MELREYAAATERNMSKLISVFEAAAVRDSTTTTLGVGIVNPVKLDGAVPAVRRVALSCPSQRASHDGPGPDSSYSPAPNPSMLSAAMPCTAGTPQPSTTLVPAPGRLIPNLPRGPDAWLKAVNQWEQADPAVPGSLALKDWPELWYTGPQRSKFAMKRTQRKLIATEYIQR